MKNGYGKNWEGADKELYDRRAKLMAAQNGSK